MEQFDRKFVVTPEGEASIGERKPEDLEKAKAFAENEYRQRVEAWAERHSKQSGLSKEALMRQHESFSKQIYDREAEEAKVRARELIEEWLKL
jgi:hypothetical protein